MTMYENLLSEYEQKVCIEERPMKNDGLYCDGFVWLNKYLSENRKLCILAEELGHHETTVGNILDQKNLNNAKQEHIARVWAYNKLLSIARIIDAVSHGHTDIWDMADYLGVDEGFLRDYLKYLGLLDV